MACMYCKQDGYRAPLKIGPAFTPYMFDARIEPDAPDGHPALVMTIRRNEGMRKFATHISYCPKCGQKLR